MNSRLHTFVKWHTTVLVLAKPADRNCEKHGLAAGFANTLLCVVLHADLSPIIRKTITLISNETMTEFDSTENSLRDFRKLRKAYSITEVAAIKYPPIARPMVGIGHCPVSCK